MTWQLAHRIAQIAAVQAHHELGVDPNQFPVLVAPAIDSAGIELMWQPLDRLFGIYLHVGGVRGILVNEELTRAARRQSAAHELAHHWLRHPPRPGSPCAVDGGNLGGPARTTWTPDEQAAEAFADWFLMPRKAVVGALAHLGLSAVAGPADAYQLSLLLGTSYRATVRHLYSLRRLTREQHRRWSAVDPARLKRSFLPGLLPSTRDVDVWSVAAIPVGRGHPTRYLSPADRLVVSTSLLLDAGGLTREDHDCGRSTLTAPDAAGAHELLIGHQADPAVLPLVVETRPHGSYPARAGTEPFTAEVGA